MLRKLLQLFIIGFICMALPRYAQALSDPFGMSQALNLPTDSIGSSTDSSSNQPQATKPVIGLPTDTGDRAQMKSEAAQVTSATTAATVPNIQTQPPQFFDYSANIKSDVFGANLFTGSFARQGATQFNPDYAVAVGDNIQVRLWGAFDFDSPLTVDPKGNIFLPHAGPIQVLGVHNQNLQRVVESAIATVFRSNVYCYASLAAAQPVRVFVSGFVNRPGLYSGTSMDSLLHYLDQAGGIDPERGSFLTVQVKRGQRVRATANLYEFLLNGTIPQIQLADGDVIFVAPRQDTVKVSGLASNAKRFEFDLKTRTVADITRIAKPFPEATHVRVMRNTGTLKNTEYYPLSDAATVSLQNGDELEFTADKKPGTITVRVEGETIGAQEYVLPYGSRMGNLLQQIRYSNRADIKSLQLFRKTIRERQKLMLQTSLKKIESSVLTARSGTTDESTLRANEAALMLQWVERAKNIEPSGQVMLARGDNVNDLLLENGDIIRVPSIDNLVLVSGEVLFPNTIAIEAEKTVEDYIKTAGGYSQNADTSRIIIAHRDGSFEDTEDNSGLFDSDTVIRPGDEILVLPQVEGKYRQLFKELSTMVYQLGLGARVLLK